MLDKIPANDDRHSPDPNYYTFLKKILIWKILINGFIIWLFYFYLIPAIMYDSGQYTPNTIFLATLGSLLINYIVIILFAYPYFSWQYKLIIKNHWWSLGDSIIFVHKGFLSLNLARIPYKRIQNLNTKQTFWDRQGGYSRIEIQTAGSGGIIAEGVIFGLKEPEKYIKLIAPYINNSIETGGVKEEIEKYPSHLLENDSKSDSEILKTLKKIESTLSSIEKTLKK